MSAAPVVYSAVPTLFGPDGETDPGANRALYRLLAGLVDGMLVAGTTGVFPSLEDAERLSLFELALAEAGPDRVIAHIGAPDARHAIRLARAAVTLGATRIAAITPYYLPARPDELAGHYRRIRDAVPGPELYAYIFPERTGLAVPPPFAEWRRQAWPERRLRVSLGRPGSCRGSARPRIFRKRRHPWPRCGPAGRDLRAQLRLPRVYAACGAMDVQGG